MRLPVHSSSARCVERKLLSGLFHVKKNRIQNCTFFVFSSLLNIPIVCGSVASESRPSLGRAFSFPNGATRSIMVNRALVYSSVFFTPHVLQSQKSYILLLETT